VSNLLELVGDYSNRFLQPGRRRSLKKFGERSLVGVGFPSPRNSVGPEVCLLFLRVVQSDPTAAGTRSPSFIIKSPRSQHACTTAKSSGFSRAISGPLRPLRSRGVVWVMRPPAPYTPMPRPILSALGNLRGPHPSAAPIRNHSTRPAHPPMTLRTDILELRSRRGSFTTNRGSCRPSPSRSPLLLGSEQCDRRVSVLSVIGDVPSGWIVTYRAAEGWGPRRLQGAQNWAGIGVYGRWRRIDQQRPWTAKGPEEDRNGPEEAASTLRWYRAWLAAVGID